MLRGLPRNQKLTYNEWPRGLDPRWFTFTTYRLYKDLFDFDRRETFSSLFMIPFTRDQ